MHVEFTRGKNSRVDQSTPTELAINLIAFPEGEKLRASYLVTRQLDPNSGPMKAYFDHNEVNQQVTEAETDQLNAEVQKI